MFDEKKTILALYILMKSLKGKQAREVVFEAYLTDGGVLEFKAIYMREQFGNVVYLPRKKRKRLKPDLPLSGP